MAGLGFQPINKENTAFSNGEIIVADLQKSNIVRDAAGNISVIDADCKLHTKDVGGNYSYFPVEHDLPQSNLREMKASVMEGQPMFFRTEDGEVLGYTLNDEIYIDPRVATPDTPIHEYTHLWAQGLRKANPTAWAQLTEEMKGVEDGRLWEYVRGRYPELKNEDELTDEVFAHYSGKRGRERLEADMREEMSKTHDVFEKAKVATMFHKLREILSKFWNMARDLFAGKVEGIENLTADDFADMALGDLARGFDPVRVRTEQSKALDKEYMEAVERGDIETAQRMVNEAAERAGYTTNEDYKMTHTAPNGRDGFSKSIDDPSGLYPDDLYSPNGARYYGDGEEWMDRTSAAIFRRVHNNPDAMVKVYRAVPKSLKETKLRNGDWVSINREYAKEHGERNINGGYKIIEDEVPAKYVYTDANSLHEQGYDDGNDYAYQNTKNNRKLLDAVTYDDNGNVIPLSKRFNKRNADIRFQKANTIDPRTMSIEERQRRGDMLRNAPAIDVEQGKITKTENKSARKAAEEWWDNNVGEPKTYDTEVGNVVIDRKSVESSLAHRYSQMKLDAITSLVDGFNNAVYLGSMPDAERRATQNHYFAYPINYNGERCYVFCRALHDNNTNRLHLHEVFVENNIKKGDTLQTAALKPHGGITLYRDVLANVLDISTANVQQNSETAKNNSQDVESENDISAVTRIGEGPQVTYTPYDEALKRAKKAGYTKAQFDRHIERVWNQRKKTDERFAEKLNLGDRVNVILDIDELEGMNLTDRQKRAKGWYDTKTGKIYVIMYNNTGMDDVFQTILHEGVAHHGLRELFGENFDTFLDDVYAHSTEDIRREIASLSKKYNWNVRTATEEYMAKMAETQNFEHPQYESWWRMVKDWFRRMVKKIGMGDWIGNHTITENELRFVLWRSWKNLTEPEGNWGYVRQAQDIAMQAELGVGEYADKAPYGRDWKVEKQREEVPAAAEDGVAYQREEQDIEEINNRFNEELQKQVDGTLPNGHVYDMGKPGSILLSTGIANVPIQLSATKLKEKASDFDHDYELSEVKDLVKAINKPLAVFKYGNEKKAQNIVVEIQHNDKNFIVGLAIRPSLNGRVLEINSIRNVFPKDNAEWLNWIQQGKLLYADKEKIQTLIDQQRTNLADVEYLDLDSVAKIVNYFENPQINLQESEDGIMLRDGEEEAEGKEEDIWKDKTIGMQERLTAAKLRMAEQNKESLETVNEAVKAVGGNLDSLIIAMNLQKMYDRQTVKRVSDLARIMIQYGHIDELKRGEVKRLLSVVENATGKIDVGEEIDKVMDIMIDIMLRNAESRLSALEKLKGNKVDAKGVVVGGKLDPAGQQYMRAFREAKEWSTEALGNKIAEMENDMTDPNMSIAEEAAWKASAYRSALEYVQNIRQSRMDERQLKDDLHKEELKVYDVEEVPVLDEKGNEVLDRNGEPKMKKVKHVKEEFVGDIDNPTRKQVDQTIEAIEETIRQMKIERLQAYNDLTTRIGGSLADSMKKAKKLKDENKKRVESIQHFANSDMEGRELKGQQKDTAMDKVSNNPIVRAVLSPLMNLDQMLRMFGKKSPDGKGYLWEKFMYDWQKSADGEQVWQERYMDKLNDKVAEIFGKTKTGAKYKYWMLEHYAKSKPGMTVRYWDGAEQTTLVQLLQPTLHQRIRRTVQLKNKIIPQVPPWSQEYRFLFLQTLQYLRLNTGVCR